MTNNQLRDILNVQGETGRCVKLEGLEKTLVDPDFRFIWEPVFSSGQSVELRTK